MFDLRRFLRLAAVQWAEHGRGYLWFLAIGIVVHACVWLLLTLGGTRADHYSLDAQVMVYIVGYVVTATLFAGRYFVVLSRRESGLTYLMRPGSTFEKFLLAFVVVALLYPLAFTLAFQVCNLPGAWLGEAARDLLVREAGDKEVGAYLVNMKYGPYVPFLEREDLALETSLLLCGISLQALVLAGALYFHRMAWLKTLVALFLLLFIAIPLLSIVADAEPWRLIVGGRYHPAGAGWWLWIRTVWIGVPALLWIGVYFLLRERELQ